MISGSPLDLPACRFSSQANSEAMVDSPQKETITEPLVPLAASVLPMVVTLMTVYEMELHPQLSDNLEDQLMIGLPTTSLVPVRMATEVVAVES